MGFGGKRAQAAMLGGDRLAAIAGASSSVVGAPAGAPALQRRRGEIQPDTSRIRPRQLEETPEARQRRLAAKSINFTATIIARLVILAAVGLWAWKQYEFTGQFHRGVAVGMLAILGDFGRVIMKATTPGTK